MHSALSGEPAKAPWLCSCGANVTVKKFVTHVVDTTENVKANCPMVETWTKRKFMWRAIFASAIACLLALQGVTIILPTKFAPASESGPAVAFAVEHCHAHEEDKTPGQGHCDHSQCCIFCSAHEREASLPTLAALFSVATYLAPRATISVVLRFIDDPRERPLGWDSSWSSRAPPSFV